jgi:hypothetical protein
VSDALLSSPLISDQLFWYVYAVKSSYFQHITTPDYVYYPLIEKTVFWLFSNVLGNASVAASIIASAALYLKAVLVSAFMFPIFDNIVKHRVVRLGLCVSLFFTGNIDNFFIQNIPYFHILFLSFLLVLAVSDIKIPRVHFSWLVFFSMLILSKTDLAVLVPVAVLGFIASKDNRRYMVLGVSLALIYLSLVVYTSRTNIQLGWIREDGSIFNALFDGFKYSSFVFYKLVFFTSEQVKLPLAITAFSGFVAASVIYLHKYDRLVLRPFLVVLLLYLGQSWFTAYARGAQLKPLFDSSIWSLSTFHHGHIMQLLYGIVLLGIFISSIITLLSSNSRIVNIGVVAMGIVVTVMLGVSHSNIGSAHNNVLRFTNMDTHPEAFSVSSDICLISPWVYWRQYIPSMTGLCKAEIMSLPALNGGEYQKISANVPNRYKLNLNPSTYTDKPLSLAVFVASSTEECTSLRLLSEEGSGLFHDIAGTSFCAGSRARVVYFDMPFTPTPVRSLYVELPKGLHLLADSSGNPAYIFYIKNIDTSDLCADKTWSIHCYYNGIR